MRHAPAQSPCARYVAVRGGVYELAAPVEIGAAHSGITIENYNGEHATVSGGVAFTVPKAAWSPYKQKIRSGGKVAAIDKANDIKVPHSWTTHATSLV